MKELENELAAAELELALTDAAISLRHQEGWKRLVRELTATREKSMAELISMPAEPTGIVRAQTWILAIDKLVGFEKERLAPGRIEKLREEVRVLRSRLEEYRLAGITHAPDHFERKFFEEHLSDEGQARQ